MMKNMKRLISFAVAAILLVCAVSCGKNDDSTDPSLGESEYASAIDLLNAVWGAYAESEKFDAYGGDENNLNEKGPGKFSVEDAETLDSVLGLPASLADKVDSAANLFHAKNVNTFTCGVFHFKSETDTNDAVSKIKSNILSRHWMCGFPDTMLIISAPGNYIIAVWGIDEGTGVVSTFKNKVLQTVNGSAVKAEEPII